MQEDGDAVNNKTVGVGRADNFNYSKCYRLLDIAFYGKITIAMLASPSK